MNKKILIAGVLLLASQVFAGADKTIEHPAVDDRILAQYEGALMTAGLVLGENDNGTKSECFHKTPNVLGVNESQNVGALEIVDRFGFRKLVIDAAKNAEAQVKLGDLLYFGNDLIRDEEGALKWWKKAAHSSREYQTESRAKACFRLAKYHFGKDREKAMHYLKKAARFGHSESQMTLYMLMAEKKLKKDHGELKIGDKNV